VAYVNSASDSDDFFCPSPEALVQSHTLHRAPAAQQMQLEHSIVITCPRTIQLNRSILAAKIVTGWASGRAKSELPTNLGV
jgi:hypothetical protein